MQTDNRLLDDIARVMPTVAQSELGSLLSPAEMSALLRRADHLVTSRVFPAPSPEWPAIPWPVF